jgi:hypothetical protein
MGIPLQKWGVGIPGQGGIKIAENYRDLVPIEKCARCGYSEMKYLMKTKVII